MLLDSRQHNQLVAGAALLVALCTLALYLFPLPTGLTWQHDEGDLAAAAYTGGNPHPHGYPTYMLAARLAIAVQGGDVSVRIARLSALCGAIAAALITIFAYRILGRIVSNRQNHFLIVSAALAGLVYGTLPLVWAQAILVEMYALASVFSAVLLLLGETINRRLRESKPCARYFGLFGLIYGVGGGAHVTISVAALAIGVPMLIGLVRAAYPIPTKIRFVLLSVGGMLIGLCVFVLLPLSANRSPVSNWGGASTWEGVVWMVTAAAYRGQVVWRLSPEKWLYLMAMTVREFTIPLLIIAGGGFWVLWDRFRAFAVGCALAILISIQFLTMYDVTNVFAYLLPAYALIAVMLAIGTFAIMDRMLVQPGRGQVAIVLSLLFFTWVAVNAAVRLPTVSLRDNRDAQAYITSAADVIPRGAFIFSATDQTTFALWYAQAVLYPEKGWMVIEARMLDQQWYRETLARFNPSIVVETWALPLPALIDRLKANGAPVYTTFDPNQYAIEGVPVALFYRISRGAE